MEVSNSTGTKSEFRVTGTGGGTRSESTGDGTEPELLWAGFLEPEGRDCNQLNGWTGGKKCRVLFLIEGVEVACATFFKDPELVTLKGDDWGYRIHPAKLPE